jgi:hypothetical protein
LFDADDGVVGHDVLDRDRRVANLDDFAVKRTRRKRVDCEIDILSHFDRADIRSATFESICIFVRSFAIWKITGAASCGNGLANIDAARNHHAIDGDVIVQWSRSAFALSSAPLFDFHVRFA